MQFVPYQYIRSNSPSALRKKLTREGAIVLTVGSKLIAAMVSLDDENVQDNLLMVSRMRAQMAARGIRSQAHRDGLNRMTLREVNALIKETRTKRK